MACAALAAQGLSQRTSVLGFFNGHQSLFTNLQRKTRGLLCVRADAGDALWISNC